MNVITKAWRNFKIRVAKRRQNINVDNKFCIGDFVKNDCVGWDINRGEFHFGETGEGETGEVVDAFYGFDMNRGYRWHYKVQYKRRETVIVLYEETEICIDAAWIRNQKLKKLGI